MTMTDSRASDGPGADLLRRATETDNFTLGRPFHLRPLPGGQRVLYLQSEGTRRSADLWMFDRTTGKAQRLLAADELLDGQGERLSADEKARRERQRIRTTGFTRFDLSRDGSRVVLKLSGDLYLLRLDKPSPTWTKIELSDGVILDPRLSPSGRKLAFVKDYDLFVAELPEEPRARTTRLKARALTHGGTSLQSNGLAEFVAQEEMGRMRGFWWRPDEGAIAYQHTDTRNLETFTIADAAHPERPSTVFRYPRPGKANAEVRVHVISVNGASRTEIDWDRERFPYLARFVWSPRGTASILVQSRDQEHQLFLRAREDGRTELMFEEKDPSWLNLTAGAPTWLPDGESYLYATEASGFWQLERHWPRPHGPGLARREVVLDVDSGFDKLSFVDADHGWVWFSGGPNPTETHIFRARLDGTGHPAQISPEGSESAAFFASDGQLMTMTSASLDRLAETVVIPLSEEAPAASLPDLSTFQTLPDAAGVPPRLPNVELVSPERSLGFRSMIIRPQSFQTGKKYPVLLYVYGGPHVNVVKSDGHRFFLQQFMADRGFVVVSLDGRGTPRRGRVWERAVDRRFDTIPLEDQVRGLKALAAFYPELDLSRVGVYGWSFGGTMAALSVLDRPDMFKAAVSGAPVTDWLYYDTHYTERYLGVPTEADSSVYERTSLVERAPKLSRPLLLIHGIADDNVYFAHSLRLADALFKAGKPFEMLPLVGLTHQVADPDVRLTLYERIMAFFEKHLR